MVKPVFSILFIVSLVLGLSLTKSGTEPESSKFLVQQSNRDNSKIGESSQRGLVSVALLVLASKLFCFWKGLTSVLAMFSCPVLTISLTEGGNHTTAPIKPPPLPPHPGIPVACNHTSDLIVLLDSSGSIATEDFKMSLDFGGRFAKAWRRQKDTRVGVYLFSSNVFKVYSLAESLLLSEEGAYQAIIKAPHLQGETYTHLALEAAFEDFARTPSSTSMSTILVTDGKSSYPNLTMIAAKMIQRARIRSFSVGVGAANYDELYIIAGNESQNVFTVTQYHSLFQICRPISDEICKRVGQIQ